MNIDDIIARMVERDEPEDDEPEAAEEPTPESETDEADVETPEVSEDDPVEEPDDEPAEADDPPESADDNLEIEEPEAVSDDLNEPVSEFDTPEDALPEQDEFDLPQDDPLEANEDYRPAEDDLEDVPLENTEPDEPLSIENIAQQANVKLKLPQAQESREKSSVATGTQQEGVSLDADFFSGLKDMIQPQFAELHTLIGETLQEQMETQSLLMDGLGS